MENKNQKTLQVDVERTKTETIKKEIKLPYYSKSENYEYFKVLDTGNYATTRVRWRGTADDGYASIDNGFNFRKAVEQNECSQEEYDNAFNEVQKILFDKSEGLNRNSESKKTIADYIKEQIDSLDEKDVESNLWWAKFLEITQKYT